jgi:hypothetical protein
LTDGSGTIPTEALPQVITQGGQVLVVFDADVEANGSGDWERLERSAFGREGGGAEEGAD